MDTTVPARASSEDELVRQVDALRRRFKLTQAEAVIRSALNKLPGSDGLWIALGRVLLSAGRTTDAADAFKKAEELCPQNDRPLAWQIATLSRQRHYTEAIKIGTIARDRFPSSLHINIALGRTFRDFSRPLEALDSFSEATRVAPADATALSWYAVGLADLHRWAEAVTAAQEAAQQNPESIKPLYRLGRIFHDDERYIEALDYFENILSKDPDHAGALEWRITALRSTYRFGDAEDRAREAIARLPQAPDLQAEYAWV
ncbi:tetratricopeptide repeat protein, partial [Acrocarpospora pleiomorpha]